MISKRLVLATAVTAFVAMAGQAYAGTTVSDVQYWPSEANSADQNPMRRAENGFDSVGAARAYQVPERPYQGGPKIDY